MWARRGLRAFSLSNLNCYYFCTERSTWPSNGPLCTALACHLCAVFNRCVDLCTVCACVHTPPPSERDAPGREKKEAPHVRCSHCFSFSGIRIVRPTEGLHILRIPAMLTSAVLGGGSPHKRLGTPREAAGCPWAGPRPLGSSEPCHLLLIPAPSRRGLRDRGGVRGPCATPQRENTSASAARTSDSQPGFWGPLNAPCRVFPATV